MSLHHGGAPFLSLVLLCLSPLPAHAADAAATLNHKADKAVWAWADRVGGDNVVFVSRRVDGAWSSPQPISEKGGINVVPSVSSNGSDDDLFAVWTNYSDSQAQLRYRQLKAGSWGEEQEYYTGLVSNTAATLADDASGTLWMVWAGYNGVSDEIYYSRWNGSSFDTAKAITANDIPDILPVLGIDETTGLPWVQWLQFSPSGYNKYETTWDGSAWTEPVRVEAEEKSAAAASTANARALPARKLAASGDTPATSTEEDGTLRIEIPSFVTSPESASLHIPGYPVRSLPVRSMTDAE